MHLITHGRYALNDSLNIFWVSGTVDGDALLGGCSVFVDIGNRGSSNDIKDTQANWYISNSKSFLKETQ